MFFLFCELFFSNIKLNSGVISFVIVFLLLSNQPWNVSLWRVLMQSRLITFFLHYNCSMYFYVTQRNIIQVKLFNYENWIAFAIWACKTMTNDFKVIYDIYLIMCPSHLDSKWEFEAFSYLFKNLKQRKCYVNFLKGSFYCNLWLSGFIRKLHRAQNILGLFGTVQLSRRLSPRWIQVINSFVTS